MGKRFVVQVNGPGRQEDRRSNEQGKAKKKKKKKKEKLKMKRRGKRNLELGSRDSKIRGVAYLSGIRNTLLSLK